MAATTSCSLSGTNQRLTLQQLVVTQAEAREECRHRRRQHQLCARRGVEQADVPIELMSLRMVCRGSKHAALHGRGREVQAQQARHVRAGEGTHQSRAGDRPGPRGGSGPARQAAAMGSGLSCSPPVRACPPAPRWGKEAVGTGTTGRCWRPPLPDSAGLCCAPEQKVAWQMDRTRRGEPRCCTVLAARTSVCIARTNLRLPHFGAPKEKQRTCRRER